MMDLQKKYNFAYVFIAHDLSVVKYISDTIGVMYLGKIVEEAEDSEIFADPLHPYTKALISSIPIENPDQRSEHEEILEGEIPSPLNVPSGCPFHPRCKEVMDICKTDEPDYIQIKPNHKVRCHLYCEK